MAATETKDVKSEIVFYTTDLVSPKCTHGRAQYKLVMWHDNETLRQVNVWEAKTQRRLWNNICPTWLKIFKSLRKQNHFWTFWGASNVIFHAAQAATLQLSVEPFQQIIPQEVILSMSITANQIQWPDLQTSVHVFIIIDIMCKRRLAELTGCSTFGCCFVTFKQPVESAVYISQQMCIESVCIWFV